MVFADSLIRVIETHWASISSQALDDVRDNAETAHLRNAASALRKEYEDICLHLSERLGAGQINALASAHEELGLICLERGIPPHEVILALQLLKARIFRAIREAAPGQDSWKLFAQEDVENRIGDFFDRLAFYVIRGYWMAAQALSDSPAGPPGSHAAHV